MEESGTLFFFKQQESFTALSFTPSGAVFTKSIN